MEPWSECTCSLSTRVESLSTTIIIKLSTYSFTAKINELLKWFDCVLQLLPLPMNVYHITSHNIFRTSNVLRDVFYFYFSFKIMIVTSPNVFFPSCFSYTSLKIFCMFLTKKWIRVLQYFILSHNVFKYEWTAKFQECLFHRILIISLPNIWKCHC